MWLDCGSFNGSKKMHVNWLPQLSLLTGASIKIGQDLVRTVSRHLRILPICQYNFKLNHFSSPAAVFIRFHHFFITFLLLFLLSWMLRQSFWMCVWVSLCECEKQWMGASTTMRKGRVFLFFQRHIDELAKFEAVCCYSASLQPNSLLYCIA